MGKRNIRRGLKACLRYPFQQLPSVFTQLLTVCMENNILKPMFHVSLFSKKSNKKIKRRLSDSIWSWPIWHLSDSFIQRITTTTVKHLCEQNAWYTWSIPHSCENTQWGAPILRTAFLNQLLIPLLSFFKYRGTNPLAYPVQSYIICKYLSNPFFPFWFV